MLRSIDGFGLPYQLTFNKSPRFKSTFGGVATIITFLIAFVCAYFFGVEIIIKARPNVVETVTKVAARLNLTINIPMAFILELNNGQTLNEMDRHLDVNLTYYDSTTDPLLRMITYAHPAKMRKYLTSDFDSSLTNLFLENALDRAWCFDNETRYIAGFYTVSSINFYKVQASPCTNTTFKTNCYPPDVIKNFFDIGDKLVSIYYQNINLRPI